MPNWLGAVFMGSGSRPADDPGMTTGNEKSLEKPDALAASLAANRKVKNVARRNSRRQKAHFARSGGAALSAAARGRNPQDPRSVPRRDAQPMGPAHRYRLVGARRARHR